MPQMGWAGYTNGDLLHPAAANGFQALVTVDQGFEHQQDVVERRRKDASSRTPALLP